MNRFYSKKVSIAEFGIVGKVLGFRFRSSFFAPFGGQISVFWLDPFGPFWRTSIIFTSRKALVTPVAFMMVALAASTTSFPAWSLKEFKC
ncbi:hypothetical protein TYRP_009671 [Tyrophagus putrescentiae]|nr:hypothetical protein TYRP_009671 [Tyrophagus putrescentiae]